MHRYTRRPQHPCAASAETRYGHTIWTVVFDALLDLVLPSDCAGCGGFSGPLCSRCTAVVTGPAVRTAPDPTPDGLPPVWTVTRYDGVAREVLLAYKEHGRRTLAGPLGLGLAGSVAAAVADVAKGRLAPVALIPIPSAPAAARRRGGDHVRRLARVAVAELRAAGRRAVIAPVLTVRRTVADSAGLSAAERAANLAHAFRAQPAACRLPEDALLVLVDDLVTTGATLAAASGALAGPGRRPHAAATLSATARRRRQIRYGG